MTGAETIIFIALYWIVGVFVMCRDWLDTFGEVDIKYFMSTVFLLWLIWPFYAIGMLWRAVFKNTFSEIVLFRSRK